MHFLEVPDHRSYSSLLLSLNHIFSLVLRPDRLKKRAWYPLFAHVLNFPEILGKSWTTILHPYNRDVKIVYYRYMFHAAFLSNDGVRRLSALL